MITTQHSNDDVDIHSFKTYFDTNQVCMVTIQGQVFNQVYTINLMMTGWLAFKITGTRKSLMLNFISQAYNLLTVLTQIMA